MLFQGRVKESDYLLAQYLHLRPRRSFAVVGVALLGLGIWVAWISHSVPLFASLICLLLSPFFIVFSAKRAFRQYKAMSELHAYDVRELGLFCKRENGEGLLPWAEIIKWRRNSKLILLYPTTNLFYVIPSHFFFNPAAFEAFAKTLHERFGKAR